jgi:hypothetical protein
VYINYEEDYDDDDGWLVVLVAAVEIFIEMRAKVKVGHFMK